MEFEDKEIKEVELNEITESKQPEIDYTKLDPVRIPHEVADKSPAFIGLKQNLFELRHQVKEMEEERSNLLEQLSAAEQSRDSSPEEYITRQQLEEKLAEKDKQIAMREAKINQDSRTRQQIESEAALKASYTTDKMGEGLDAKTVLERGGTWLAQNERDLFLAAMASGNPARKVYDLAVSMCPEFVQQKQKLHDAKLLQSLNKGRPSKLEFGEEEIDNAGQSLVDLLKLDSESLDSAIEQEEFAPD